MVKRSVSLYLLIEGVALTYNEFTEILTQTHKQAHINGDSLTLSGKGRWFKLLGNRGLENVTGWWS